MKHFVHDVGRLPALYTGVSVVFLATTFDSAVLSGVLAFAQVVTVVSAEAELGVGSDAESEKSGVNENDKLHLGTRRRSRDRIYG